MSRFQIAGQQFELTVEDIERVAQTQLPEPLFSHYTVVHGRRFPPKQLISYATRLDRADFTSHQARDVLRRLGFYCARRTRQEPAAGSDQPRPSGSQAAALAPYVGQWVALASPTDVLVAADQPQDVISWLARHNRRASYGMFRVPGNTVQASGAAPS